MAAAQVCREAGAWVTTNVMVLDLDLGVPQPALDGRRFEVVAEGVPLFGGVQLALNTTLVSLVHADGTARPDAAQLEGVAMVSARRLVPPGNGRARGRSRPLVWGHVHVLALVGRSESQARATHPPAESGVCLDGQVGCDLVLCSTGVRLLVAEPSWTAFISFRKCVLFVGRFLSCSSVTDSVLCWGG